MLTTFAQLFSSYNEVLYMGSYSEYFLQNINLDE